MWGSPITEQVPKEAGNNNFNYNFNRKSTFMFRGGGDFKKRTGKAGEEGGGLLNKYSCPTRLRDKQTLPLPPNTTTYWSGVPLSHEKKTKISSIKQRGKP